MQNNHIAFSFNSLEKKNNEVYLFSFKVLTLFDEHMSLKTTSLYENNNEKQIVTSPWLVMKAISPSNKGNKIDCTSDGALSMSSNTTQYPFRTA
jgi:hypothetical protein